MAKETYEPKQIFAGNIPYITRVKVAAGDYKRGDLLECVVTEGAMADTYAKATAAAVLANEYAVCAEDVKAEANQEVVVYPRGEFRANCIALGGESTVEDNEPILKAKELFLIESI